MVGRFIGQLVGYTSSNSTSRDWRKGQAHYIFTAGSAVRPQGGGFLGRNVLQLPSVGELFFSAGSLMRTITTLALIEWHYIPPTFLETTDYGGSPTRFSA